MIAAKIVADSVAPHGVRLTSMVLTYPRFIHNELMTHRAFSRNAASSRAIPFDRMVQMVEENPAMPERWGTRQKGMQSGPPLAGAERAAVQGIWLDAMYDAIKHAREMDRYHVHKSVSNRLLEPFAHMTTLVTATDWHNFFSLRAHPDAQYEFQVLAYLMLEQYLESMPVEVRFGEWHLPLISSAELQWLSPEAARTVSVARAARISYLNFKNDATVDEDATLVGRLKDGGHWSPFEHVATPLAKAIATSGNFRGWHQYRQQFEGHTRFVADLRQILLDRRKDDA